MIELARAAHVLGVVWWIGGVVMVATNLLPLLLRPGPSDADRLRVFQEIRQRFAWQARGAVLLVGATGACLLARLGGLARLDWPDGWWIDLMILTWAVFFLMLFVLEPLGVIRKIGLMHRPRAFLLLHIALASLGLAAVVAAVVGAHGGW